MMIMPCKTLGVFVYSRLLPCTSVCIDMCEISLGVYTLMLLNAQNILLHTVCVCFFFLPVTRRINLWVLTTSCQSCFHIKP